LDHRLAEITTGQVVAIDGKTLRRSSDTASGNAAIPMVSVWATANCIRLGQVVVDAKSNEITAIPKLLDIPDVSGFLVTIDAMSCQTEIASAIVRGGADYAMALKNNPPTLREGVREFFEDHREDDFARSKVSRHRADEKGHGREGPRSYFVRAAPDDLPDRRRWTKLKATGMTIHDTLRPVARRQGDVGNTVFHPEQEGVGSRVCGGSAWSLGN
jgi:predicted transposase YbfD/YdcC